MRKIEFALILFVVSLGAASWSRSTTVTAPGPESRVAPQKILTRSGRYQILPGPYGLAGLSIGCDESEAVAVLGKPARKTKVRRETTLWTYKREGSDLHLFFLENRLLGIVGVGRWEFGKRETQDSTLFLMGQENLRKLLGEPTRSQKSAWAYETQPGKLTVRFDKEVVAEVDIMGEFRAVNPSSAPAR